MMHLLPKFSSKIQICGTQEYASDLWNVVDFVTNSLYVATIGLRVRAFCDVSFTHFSLKAAPKRNETCLIANLPQYLPFAMWKYIIETRNFCSLLGSPKIKNVYLGFGSPHLTLKVSPRRRTKSSQPSCGPGCQLNKWIANDARLGSARATVKPGPDLYHSITLYTQNII